MARKIVARAETRSWDEAGRIRADFIARFPEARVADRRSRYGGITITASVEGETKTQTRGTCQACASSVAIVGSRSSYHGYKRPGHGYTFGDCAGSKQLPAETAVELTQEIIASLIAGAVELEELAVKLRDAINALPAYDWANDREGALRTHEQFRELEKNERHATYQARSNRRFAEHLTENALPKLGQPFTTVEV